MAPLQHVFNGLARHAGESMLMAGDRGESMLAWDTVTTEHASGQRDIVKT